MSLTNFLADEATLSVSNVHLTAVRDGTRTTFSDGHRPHDLVSHLSGQLPYFYRAPAQIAKDFASRLNALEVLADLIVKLPTTERFQRSHCGEILAALFLEDVLGLTRLYAKLSLSTSQNTNVHKSDGLFVDLNQRPHVYYAVEAKSSIQPTGASRFRGHRNGILRQLLQSLEHYSDSDKRFDLTLARDNLEVSNIGDAQRDEIRRDLIPPGPKNLVHLGVASINASTISAADDDYILTAESAFAFDFHSLAVSDLRAITDAAYSRVIEKLAPSAK